MVSKSLLSLVGTLSLLVAQVSTQTTTCNIDFYYDLAGEFNCNGLPLGAVVATAGTCVDISTVSLLDFKHWAAFQGKAVPTGCSRKLILHC